MKKLLSLLLATTLILTSFTFIGAMAAPQFSDMEDSHWAMSSVTKLVADGTINGFADGTFKPEGIVSRAEFVKMLGKSPYKFDKDFADVPNDHWAYEYIMYSGLEGDENGYFNPAKTITRGEVANLLYKRYGAQSKSIVPYFITSQGTNKDAVAWVYDTGLMVGGDMINLRLDDTLTRAEAAVLIVRAKELNPLVKKDFINNFSDEVYKTVYEASNLFDTPYEANGNITYEELSVAALRFQYKHKKPSVRYKFNKLYDEDYAIYWSVISKYAIDEKGIKATKEEGSKLVTVEDAISILTLGARNNSFISAEDIKVDEKTYPEVTLKNTNSNFSQNMRFAYNFGISLYQDGKINAKNLITKKELSCILLQYDLSFGSHIDYRCGYNAQYIPLTIRLDRATYPSNSSYYPMIANEIPNYVYEAPYAISAKVEIEPNKFVNTTTPTAHMFTNSIMYIASDLYDKGAEVYIDFFPTLTSGFGTAGDVMRTKLFVATAFDGMKLSDIMKLESGVNDRLLNAGDAIWCDIHTNQESATTLYLNEKLFTIGQIIE